jgi:hypothetical protein
MNLRNVLREFDLCSGQNHILETKSQELNSEIHSQVLNPHTTILDF